MAQGTVRICSSNADLTTPPVNNAQDALPARILAPFPQFTQITQITTMAMPHSRPMAMS